MIALSYYSDACPHHGNIYSVHHFTSIDMRLCTALFVKTDGTWRSLSIKRILPLISLLGTMTSGRFTLLEVALRDTMDDERDARRAHLQMVPAGVSRGHRPEVATRTCDDASPVARAFRYRGWTCRQTFPTVACSYGRAS